MPGPRTSLETLDDEALFRVAHAHGIAEPQKIDRRQLIARLDTAKAPVENSNQYPPAPPAGSPKWTSQRVRRDQ